MRSALWLAALFAVAVALALFAGDNQGTVTVFWPPHRVDLSVNLVLLLLGLLFVLVHLSLRAVAAMAELPRQAPLAQSAARARHPRLAAGRHDAVRRWLETLVAYRARPRAQRRASRLWPKAANRPRTRRRCAHRPICWRPKARMPCRTKGRRDAHLARALGSAGVLVQRQPNCAKACCCGRRAGPARPRSAGRAGAAGRTADRRAPPHRGAAHQAEGGAPVGPQRGRHGHRAPAGQASSLFARSRAQPGARAGGGTDPWRPRSGAARTGLDLARPHRARHA